MIDVFVMISYLTFTGLKFQDDAASKNPLIIWCSNKPTVPQFCYYTYEHPEDAIILSPHIFPSKASCENYLNKYSPVPSRFYTTACKKIRIDGKLTQVPEDYIKKILIKQL